MGKFCLWVLLITHLFSVVMVYQVLGLTSPSEVQVLQGLYKALNQPSQLVGWKLHGGDPCEESWKGISCLGSSIIFIQLNGLHLNGTLGGEFFKLFNLKQLDVSFNDIQGEIPYSLPPNATHIDLSFNNFSHNIPFSLSSMKYLRHLNLSHNSLSGPIGNVFMGLQNLKQMDLSSNSFTGDLPTSFQSLTNLTGLFLQNNKFTGSVIHLANLPLTDLDIRNNNFSGVIPMQFENVPNLWIGENTFHIGPGSTPWSFPTDTIPSDEDITNHPKAQSNAIESNPTSTKDKKKHRKFTPAAIAFTVGGVALLASCAAAMIAIQFRMSRLCKPESLNSKNTVFLSSPLSTAIDFSFAGSEHNLPSLIGGPLPIPRPRRMPSVRFRTEEFGERSKLRNLLNAKVYSVSELESATNNFSENNLLGEGSLGSVYKTKFPDGQIFIAKNIHTVELSFHEEEQFFDVIQSVARLRHPNIVALIGYCVENGQHILVYEYIRSWSLENALYYNDQQYISWSKRMTIALGIARALDYLHSISSPSVAHSNLKAANILLDDELMPHLSDCGLSGLRPFTSDSTKIRASELAISCSGYIAPENSQGRVDERKSDIFAFGVLLLELLTGRKPFDSTRTREKQSLVKWASCNLHDYEALQEMVDPRIKRALSSKCLSQFADIVSICIQPEPEFRATMSVIVERLVHLIGRSMDDEESVVGGGGGFDAPEMSYDTTRSGFIASPKT